MSKYIEAFVPLLHEHGYLTYARDEKIFGKTTTILWVGHHNNNVYPVILWITQGYLIIGTLEQRCGLYDAGESSYDIEDSIPLNDPELTVSLIAKLDKYTGFPARKSHEDPKTN